MATECSHLERVEQPDRPPVHPSAEGCQECLAMGATWVHLRLCLTCGHVGCCDSSPHRHATAHFHGTRHPVIRSFEPGEEWAWCYVDEMAVDEVPARRGEEPAMHYESPFA